MKALGLFSTLFLVAALAYTQIKWGPDYTKTFSRLVARKQSSIIYYFLVFVVFLSTFSVFMVTSFIPQFSLSESFILIYFLGVFSQLVCVTVPETGGIKTKIHLIAAGIMSSSVLLQIAFILFFVPLSFAGVIACILSLSIMLLIWLAVIFNHRLVRHELSLQALYFISYLGALLVVSYLA